MVLIDVTQEVYMLSQFISTAYTLATAGRWSELIEFFKLTRELLSQPIMQITMHKPTDKET